MRLKDVTGVDDGGQHGSTFRRRIAQDSSGSTFLRITVLYAIVCPRLHLATKPQDRSLLGDEIAQSYP